MLNQNPEFWNGCLRSNRLGVRSVNPDRPDVPLRNWIEDCVPTYNQRSTDCVGNGWANTLEAIIRYYIGHSAIPEGYQLDGYKVWWKAKQMFDGGCLSGGLLIPQGFEAMKALSWIPKDSILVEVAHDWVSQGEALLEAPLVIGHSVYAGWFNPSKENGCLDHVYKPSSKSGGHCTCRIGRSIHNNRKFYVGLNSWGSDWGWNGAFLMDDDMSQDTSLDCPYTISIPGGFSRLIDHEGWKAGLITTPYDTQRIKF
jgi:hypothetical protein